MTEFVTGVRQQGIWGSLVSNDAEALREWLIGLGFKQDVLLPGERGGQIHHCQLDWPEGGRLILSSTGERETPCRPGSTWQHVVTTDPDAVYARAGEVGALIVHDIVDQTDYPAREFTLADPDGNYWTFSTFAG
ncbi:MAG: glyoxalase [Thermoleophilia bacterium]|nr:glyoxalase [Thermoleophilia bacterium]